MKLKVEALNPEEAGRGVARLSKNIMEELNLNPRDIVEVRGKSTTVVRLWMDRKSRNTIKLDEYKRASAGVKIGDAVEIRKAHCVQGKKVVFSLEDEIEPERIANYRIFFMDVNEYIKKYLTGMPLIEGDVVVISFHRPSLELEGEGQIPVVFKISKTLPQKTVIVGEETKISLQI